MDTSRSPGRTVDDGHTNRVDTDLVATGKESLQRWMVQSLENNAKPPEPVRTPMSDPNFNAKFDQYKRDSADELARRISAAHAGAKGQDYAYRQVATRRSTRHPWPSASAK